MIELEGKATEKSSNLEKSIFLRQGSDIQE